MKTNIENTYERLIRTIEKVERKMRENKMLKEEHKALTHPKLKAPKTTAKEIAFLGL